MSEQTSPHYDENNIFAKILRDELPSQKLYEDEDTLVIMDIMPRADGHCLVLPKRAARNILDADDAMLAAVSKTTAKLARAVKAAFKADGVTIQQFNESAGGQMVFHLHVHVIPRFDNVPMRPHSGEMGDAELITKYADKIRIELHG
ncbi:MAG: HIT family protein [Nitratireductor sp.]